MKFLILLISSFFLAASLQAAKVKSSKTYLKKIDTELQNFGKEFDSFKYTLKSASQKKSFLSTDFWGIKHSLYVENSYGVITNRYPFTETWLSKWGAYEQYASNYMRNIKGVVLTPYRGRDKSWAAELKISFDFHPGYYNTKGYYNYVKQYFISNGIASNKIDAAFSHFGSLVDPMTDLVRLKAYKKIDKIYSGDVQFGDFSILERIARKMYKDGTLDINEFYTPIKHNKLYKEFMLTSDGKEIEKSLESYKEFYSNYEEQYKTMDLWDFYLNINFSLRIEGYTQWFHVAKGMSKSKKYNHLMKLKEMLDKKVASGSVKRSKQGVYTVYEDAHKYDKGYLGIDFKNGKGYWQDPFVSSKMFVSYDIDKINKSVKSINTTIKNYLALCLDETVKKFKNNTIVTDDF